MTIPSVLSFDICLASIPHPRAPRKKERAGMRVSENLWKRIDDVNLTKGNPKDCYIELAEKVKFPKGRYFQKLKEAMIIWANFF